MTFFGSTASSFCAMLALGFIVAPDGKAEPPVPVDVQLDWVANAQFAGLIVAQERGLYSAAGLAVIVTVLIAQRPEFRTDGIYVVAALVTVASSWVLLVFSFAQSYLRLGSEGDEQTHLRFHFS